MRVAAAAVLLAALVSAVMAHPDVLDVQAVPEAAAARQLLQSSTVPGAYYGATVLTASYGTAGRHLLQAGGGYGGYGRNLVQGGYGYGRGLIEDDVILEPTDPLLQYAEQRQAQADAQHEAAQQAAGGVSAAALAALKQAHTSSSSSSSSLRPSSGQLNIPAGKCYCRYDLDFSTFALAEDVCREALYTRCQVDSSLPCSWLDKFYAPVHGPGFSMPHEGDIKAFVYEDCSPSPPCACAGIRFDGTDPVPAAVACCRDLRVACKTPFSGVDCQKVEAFCMDDKPTPVLAAWSQHVLHHSDCSNYNGMPYQFANLHDLQLAAAAATQLAPAAAAATLQAAAQQPLAVENALLLEAMRSLGQQHTAKAGFAGIGAWPSLHHNRLVVALIAVTAGAVCVAIAAVVIAMRREEEEAGVQPITSCPGAALTTADVYQSLMRNAALAAPKPAACIGSSYGLPPIGLLRRDDSGDSCLSRVISIGKLSPQGSGIREPLLQHSLSRSVSDGSDVYSTCAGGMSGDSMP